MSALFIASALCVLGVLILRPVVHVVAAQYRTRR
jgi:hypothetical protein